MSNEEMERIEKQYGETEVKLKDMKKYFIETVDDDEFEIPCENGNCNCKWTSYYIYPPTGVSIKIKDTVIDYSSQNIRKILICDEQDYRDYKTMISFHDDNDRWVEDIDVNTNASHDDISFIFDNYSLEMSATAHDTERRAYVELLEELNPYDSNKDNHKIMEKWLEKHRRYYNMGPTEDVGDELPND